MPRILNLAHVHIDCFAIVDDDGRVLKTFETAEAATAALKLMVGPTITVTGPELAARAVSKRIPRTKTIVKAEFAEPEDDDHPPFVDPVKE